MVTHRVVAAALRRDGRVLLAHRTPERAWYPDVWDFPGGHVEPGETLQEALVRELGEELGITATLPAASTITFVLDDAVMEVWAVDEWTGTPENRATDEHDDLRWFTAAEAADLELADPEYAGLIDRLLA